MELSMFLAKIISLVYLAVAIGALSSTVKLDKVMDDFLKSPGLTYLAGFMAIILGMIMVEYHNIWVKDWPVLITIIGWIAVIKGIALIAFPQLMNYSKPIFKKLKLFGFVALALGLLFGYFGFVA